jgi:hypothetical protein
MISQEVRQEIDGLVRSGFYDKGRLIEIFCEEMYEPGELPEEEVANQIDLAFSRLSDEMATWPLVTDCNKLDTVFSKLNNRGIIALQNAGYTQSDGHDDCMEIYHAAKNKNALLGYCYYHGQDLERAVRGEGLLFAFGPIDPDEEETKGPVIGQIIKEELEREGFIVDWNGTFNKRINVPNLVWRKRIMR